ncbi:hypothetical protein ACG0Z6_14135 [Roseateles sp. BYS180W]|uniref:Extradiol ring-cleavage dioxygenase class III enzyme subunit B domain-containing protein n=1 Tax=Roseateles rivi TaxID=3299028 RepID=A0ABW7FYH7_9BURK
MSQALPTYFLSHGGGPWPLPPIGAPANCWPTHTKTICAPATGLLKSMPQGCRLDAQIDDADAMAREMAHWPFTCTIHQSKALREAVLRLGQDLQRMAARGGRRVTGMMAPTQILGEQSCSS